MDVIFPPPSKKQQTQAAQKPLEKTEKDVEVDNSKTPEKGEEEAAEKPNANIIRSKPFPLFNYEDDENLWYLMKLSL